MSNLLFLGEFVKNILAVLKDYSQQIFLTSFFVYLVFCLLKYVFADFFATVLFQIEDKTKPILDENGNAIVVNGKVQYEKKDKKVNSLIPVFTWFSSSIVFLFVVKYNISLAMTCGLCISLLSSCMDNILCVFRNIIQSLIALCKFIASKIKRDDKSSVDYAVVANSKSKDDVIIELLTKLVNTSNNASSTTNNSSGNKQNFI